MTSALRTIAIWVFGLLASIIVGGLIGGLVDAAAHSGGWGPLLGMLAGLFAFPCVRLWLAERREHT
jgi:hypothetical protein